MSKNEASTIKFDFSEISEIKRDVKLLVVEKQRANDLLSSFSQIDFDVKMLSSKVEADLKQTVEIKAYMQSRLKTLDSLEAKWNLLLTRVDSVCQELERALKQM